MRRSVPLLMLLLMACSVQPRLVAQVAHFVDPMLGVDGGGNTIPGPSLPFGMIKPGPDVGDNIANAGWDPSGDINGFSQTHVSGTGGGAKYGNILVQPTTGDIQTTGYGSRRDHEQASIGYYRVGLARYPIEVEIATAARSAIYRFTFPAASHANILFDVAHCLTAYYPPAEGQKVTASSIHIASPSEVSGSSSVTGGWNEQPNSYTVYFYAVTDTPSLTNGTWQASTIHPGVAESQAGRGFANGGWLTFSTHHDQQVRLKIAISFISVEQAKHNLNIEIPDFDFDAIHTKAVTTWNKILGNIEITGTTPEQQQTFYTALYHTMLMPVDRTGDNPLWHSDEPYYDDFYAIWDTFRTSSPLITLIAPERQSQIVRALVDIYRHEGWLPDARSGNYNGRTQGGSNADFLIGDAYVKHLPGIDWQAAYRALLQDAEVSPHDQVKEGRGGLDDWIKLGYLTMEGVDRPGSKQMEYAANDFEISLVAKGLGKSADSAKYLERSSNWKSLWDPEFADGGFIGFIRPRHRDGSWKQDFTALQSCSWGGDTFYEGNSWTYSTFVPQDVNGLIQMSRGPERFVSRLDAFFQVPGRYDVGNEPGFLSPYLYIWAARHDKTAEHVRQIIAANFHSGRNGLPGNDDSGAMSSWYAWGMIGLFPNAGQDVYLIGSPQFRTTAIRLKAGRTFTIDARNHSQENKYVVAASLNGKPLNRAWLRHEDIVSGGRLTLTMSATPGTWPTGAVPPSASDSYPPPLDTPSKQK